ncbi:hypothetical protein [Tritonibacter scottomollicae]|uniref:hypothetical protein n=1 Tax=Tritonibacter scottomollicae TaxID=483013 RepID=UPI003BA910F3
MSFPIAKTKAMTESPLDDRRTANHIAAFVHKLWGDRMTHNQGGILQHSPQDPANNEELALASATALTRPTPLSMLIDPKMVGGTL